MNKITRYVLSIFLIVILIILFTPIFVMIYEAIFGTINTGIGDIDIGLIGKYIVGFILSYTFFIPLTFTVLFDKPEKYYAIYAFIGFELFFMLSDISVFIMTLILAAIGWLIGEGILRIWKMIKK